MCVRVWGHLCEYGCVCAFVHEWVCVCVPDLSGLGEEQHTVALFEPQPEERLHHHQFARAFPVAKVLLFLHLVFRNVPQHTWASGEQIWVVTDLTHGDEAREYLCNKVTQLNVPQYNITTARSCKVKSHNAASYIKTPPEHTVTR